MLPAPREPLAGARGDLQRTWQRVQETSACERIQEINLVQDELDRDVVGPDLREDGVDGGDRLAQPVAEAGIGDVQDEVRDECLLERRRETLDELRG